MALGLAKTGKKEFALSDFIGSVTCNTLLIGVLVLMQSGQVIIGQNINRVIWVFVAAMVVWWITTHSRQFLSSKEALLLLAGYAALVATVLMVIMQTAGLF
jgi:Ca2+/Na+ antiporter